MTTPFKDGQRVARIIRNTPTEIICGSIVMSKLEAEQSVLTQEGWWTYTNHQVQWDTNVVEWVPHYMLVEEERARSLIGSRS